MSKITAQQLIDALQRTLSAAALLDPRAALAEAGIEALTGIFKGGGELKGIFIQIAEETAETAPEVAQAVSKLYGEGSDAIRASFIAHPGE